MFSSKICLISECFRNEADFSFLRKLSELAGFQPRKHSVLAQAKTDFTPKVFGAKSGLKTPSAWSRGLSLVETVVAMVVMTLVAGAITQTMISIEKTQYLADRRAALTTESARQSELVRGMPLSLLLTELPNSGEKVQRLSETDGKLTGIIAQDTERASVWWTRTENILPVTGEKIEMIQVDLHYTLWGNQVQIGYTNQVLRLMERETRLGAE